MWLLVVFLAFIGLACLCVVLSDAARARKIRALRVEYDAALGRLRTQPRNTITYELAQRLGRAIILQASRTRGRVIFTEATLQNDLHAATRERNI